MKPNRFLDQKIGLWKPGLFLEEKPLNQIPLQSPNGQKEGMPRKVSNILLFSGTANLREVTILQDKAHKMERILMGLRTAVAAGVVVLVLSDSTYRVMWPLAFGALALSVVVNLLLGLAWRRSGVYQESCGYWLQLGVGLYLALFIYLTGGVRSLYWPLLVLAVVAAALRFSPGVVLAMSAMHSSLFGLAALARHWVKGEPLGFTGLMAGVFVLMSAGAFLSYLVREEQEQRGRSVFDTLTGLYNREYLVTRLVEACAGIGSFGPPFCVLMIDIDNFKDINDTHGHSYGDLALQEVAYAIRSNLRSFDVAARFGGEEFIILLANAMEEEALGVADRLRQNVADCHFLSEPGRRPYNVTVSIGLTAYGPGRDTVEGLIEAADRALYWVKRNGKNGVMSFARLSKGSGAIAERRKRVD